MWLIRLFSLLMMLLQLGEYDGVLLSVKICRRKDNIATGVTRNS